ncbi:hypothetical protein AKJ09_07061 [Labilithrix luteola]|uniref:Lipoprotein n=1 Tax=Labilithrix luteola TaxID=1391654 RepID=A0A0K1Q3R9_9BACT|nr:hypothetical protein [Labilithrix luteola]AKV00398.1 hypothetical protein AKJ09_07061 [Labilithrix luteola]
MLRSITASLLAFAFTVFGSGSQGCSSTTCETGCQGRYDECMDRAPPGAARSDCQAQYARCVEACNRN